MSLKRVVITTTLSTHCPNGGTDINAVYVSWKPEGRVDAEQIEALVSGFAGREIYCEDLAVAIADALWDVYAWPAEVTVRQLSGHGVEAVAEVP